MSKKTIQDILPLVEQPSRYLGSEVNRIQKDPGRIKLWFALAFPDLYEIGTSHFGLQILYHILNSHKEIAAERVFSPAVDMENRLRSSQIPVISLESHKPLGHFDIIGFSLLYELNFTNILTMLDLSNIPFYARQRNDSHPFVIAGGPCTGNPEPVADFFDAIVVGDGEHVIVEMTRTWLEWKEGGRGDKEILLKKWSEIEGVYIPSFFDLRFDGSGFQILSPEYSHHQVIRRAVLNDLDKAPFPGCPIIPFGRPVHDRLRIEISRGCTRGCRFCQAGMIYRPARERSPETILSLADTSIAATGYEDISLLSLSSGDYGCLVPLMERLMTWCQPRHIAVSFPSLRAGTLTPELMELIKKVRKTGFTIAPEAGSQRLRNVINKNISTPEIHDTVEDAFQLGWRVIKLYFMIGLPTETDTDLQAIVELVKDLRNKKNKKGRLNISVTTFIPKSHTPFQWASQIPLTESKEKIKRLRNELRMPGVRFKWQNPEASLLEGLWARGDRRLSRLLVEAYQRGCRFDGWSDRFDYGLWRAAFSQGGVDVDFYTTRERGLGEPLPWDHIDTRVTKDFLRSEWGNAVHGIHTPDCRNGRCNTCGVCDFENIQPKVFEVVEEGTVKTPRAVDTTQSKFKRLRVSYSKQGPAKYFGHLELSNIFLRAIRRAGIPVKFSEGFHPKPKVSFDDPLPVGLESLQEKLYLIVPDDVVPQDVAECLNQHLPEGLGVHDCRFETKNDGRKSSATASYRATVRNGAFNEKSLNSFIDSKEFIFTRTNRKGRSKTIDLKWTVLQIELTATDSVQMTLRVEPGKTVRPAEVLEQIFKLSDEQIRLADIVKVG
ncbi:TIGR03960 family B12-binding radical SAM protein [Thermodesulfobacteriota bacterium]